MYRNRVRYFIEIIIHALFWLGLFYALKAYMAPSYTMVVDHGGGSVERVDVRLLFPYSWVVLGSLMLLFYGLVFWLFRKAIRLKSNLGRVVVIGGWFVLLFVFNFLLIRTLMGPAKTVLPRSQPAKIFFESKSDTVAMRPPPLPPPPRLEDFPADGWPHMQLAMVIVFLSILAIAAAYFFIKEWIRNDLVRSHAETQQLDTEIRFLRSQVNPHFLFNTLNNLFSMAQKKGHEDLADSISKLSGMMRYMLYESNTDTVPLQREIVYLEDCIALNKLRYTDSEVSVRFRFPAPAVSTGIAIAPMLFVSFLENAFKHGVMIGRHADIFLEISVGQSEVPAGQKKLIFTCINTDFSSVKKLDEEKGGIGLENVRRRLELLYPGRHVLRAGAAEGKYTVNLQIELA